MGSGWFFDLRIENNRLAAMQLATAVPAGAPYWRRRTPKRAARR